MLFVGSALSAAPAVAAATELFFSEYIEGSSNNKALEIYNGTGVAVDLAAGGYNVQMYFNGSASAGLTINLTGTVIDGDVFLIAHSSASATILAQADQTNGAGWFNGDDAVVLRRGTTIVDVIGQIGVDPGTEWGTGLTSTADNTLRRDTSVTAGDTNGADVFDPSTEWVGFATDTFDGLGAHIGDTAPQVTLTSPADGAGGVALDVNITITFSENVSVSGAWYSIDCSASGAHAATVSG
ncbi:MAG: lamin tail domain-containing protein, partial [Dehalococcoidia bacterium]